MVGNIKTEEQIKNLLSAPPSDALFHTNEYNFGLFTFNAEKNSLKYDIYSSQSIKSQGESLYSLEIPL